MVARCAVPAPDETALAEFDLRRPYTIMDDLALLRLQIAFGADEFLLDEAEDRRNAAPPKQPPVRAPARAVRLTAQKILAGPADATRLAESCGDLPTLQAAMASFTGCALRETATKLVFADGPENSQIMLIGEAPGAEEDRAGIPFVGPAGLLLNKMLASIKLPRETVRIINVVPWRPPGNRTPSEAEIAVCLPFLLRHIALIQPKTLLLLGAVAAKALLPEPERSVGIKKLRGRWRDVEIPGLAAPIACLPTYHPAYLLRVPSEKAELWRDLLQLRERFEL